MRRRWSPLLLAFVGACSFSASCGGKKVNMENAQAFVAKTLEAQAGVKPEASCPSSVEAKQGAKFECTAKFGPGVEAKVVIVQDDDKGNVTIESVKGILISKRLETEVAEGVGKQANVHVDVNCGDRVRAATAGGTFQCDLKDANGQTAKVNVTVKDTDGNVSWEVVKG